MTGTNYQTAPMLKIEVSTSPLLSSSSSDTVFSPAVLRTIRSTHSLASLTRPDTTLTSSYSDGAPSLATSATTTSSTSSLLTPIYCVRSVPEITVTRPLSEYLAEEKKPLPVSSKQVISLLDLLDKIDRDMACEVQRVKGNIADARAYVHTWREEARAREAECRRRRAQERKDTKEPDSDFWLGV
ncbi:hypothetical protein FA95DRAFT_1605399 [Auriscalpium vulgare]|uniref:Uncharacterized protein n=1 Tax=Auriscalpium vulgare TaxID=40419 RepID=A0ACB8RVN6_9AGAM|nr:hypothetical protein FA95DRAFT_1605399 [Auriscalpium vulgare]